MYFIFLNDIFNFVSDKFCSELILEMITIDFLSASQTGTFPVGFLSRYLMLFSYLNSCL